MKMGIYKITSPSGKVYIGQSIKIEKRWNGYKRLDCISQPKLYNSLIKYGPENHKFEIIEECIQNKLIEREIHWKQHYNSINEGLNCEMYDKGFGPKSEEAKKKIGLSNSKPKPKGFGNMISKANKGISRNKGKIFTDLHKQNLSQSIKGKKSKFKQLSVDLNQLKVDYNVYTTSQLAIKYKISIPTMINLLKNNNIFEFRKNYKKQYL